MEGKSKVFILVWITILSKNIRKFAKQVNRLEYSTIDSDINCGNNLFFMIFKYLKQIRIINETFLFCVIFVNTVTLCYYFDSLISPTIKL